MPGDPPTRRPSRLLVIGLTLVVIAVVLGLVLVQRIGKTYRDGLDVAAESAAIAAEAAVPLQRMSDDLIEFARAAEQGISDARVVVASAAESLEQLADAAETELAGTVEGVASLANRVAGVVESIERFIPGNRASAAEDLRQIADGLAPVPDQLRALAEQLDSTAAELVAADETLATLEQAVSQLGDELEALAPTVADISATADLLVERVDDAKSRTTLDLWLARVVVVLIGAVLAIGLVLADRRCR